MATAKQKEIAESIEVLKSHLKVGDTITAVRRAHNPRSGSSQWDFYKFDANGNRVERAYLTYHMAKVLGYRLARGTDNMCLPFMNMDPAFHVVYTLATVLFGDGYAIKKEAL